MICVSQRWCSRRTKALGGPASSGGPVVRCDPVVQAKPTAPGGGTVSFVLPSDHNHQTDLAAREEAGTPNALGDIRTAFAAIVRSCMIEAGLKLLLDSILMVLPDPDRRLAKLDQLHVGPRGGEPPETMDRLPSM